MVGPEQVPPDRVIAAPGVAMLRVAPVRRLDRVGPEADRGGIAVEVVVRDQVPLPVLDRDPEAVSDEAVSRDL